MNVAYTVCDECGERKEPPGNTWLTVSKVGGESVDICSYACLEALAAERNSMTIGRIIPPLAKT